MSTHQHLRRPSRRGGTRLGLLLAAVAGVATLAGCGGSATGNEAAVSDDGSVDLAKVTLIVGDQKGGSKALLAAAGELDDVEYEIEWKEFTSGPPLLEALGSNAIHVGGVGNTPPLFAAAGNAEFQAIQAATYGGTGDAIVVPPGSSVKSVADLEGKTVAVAKGSSANYHLLAQLEAAGVRFSEVTVQDLQPGDALAAFDSGHVDAWAIWEPYTSQAEQDADAFVIADGTELANGYVFQVASQAALDDDATAAALEDYVARIARAQVWSQTHQEDWARVWAEETGLPEAVTLAAVSKRRIQVVPIDETVVESEQQMADAFVQNGLLPQEFDVAPYFSDAYNEFALAAK